MNSAIEKPKAAGESRGRKVWGALIKFGVPLVVSIGLCYLLFKGQNVGEMVTVIRTQCDFRWIALCLCLAILSHVIRAMRWGIQLRALGIKVPLFALVLSIFGCYAVNLVLPRLGELWRSGYIARRQAVAFDRVFGSMIADRLSDTIVVGLLTLVTFIFAGNAMMEYLGQNRDTYHRLTDLMTSPWLWAGIAAAAVLTGLLLHALRRTRFVKKLADFCRGIWQGFAVIATMPGKGRWLLLTVLLWGCYFIQLYVAFYSFPLTAEVIDVHGVMAVFVCWVLSSLSMGVPSNGGIGPWQWAVVFGLGIYSAGVPGLTTQYATTFANLVMGTNTLLLIALGLFTFACIALGRRRGHSVPAKPDSHV